MQSGSKTKVPLAVVGIVPCKVSAANGRHQRRRLREGQGTHFSRMGLNTGIKSPGHPPRGRDFEAVFGRAGDVQRCQCRLSFDDACTHLTTWSTTSSTVLSGGIFLILSGSSSHPLSVRLFKGPNS